MLRRSIFVDVAAGLVFIVFVVLFLIASQSQGAIYFAKLMYAVLMLSIPFFFSVLWFALRLGRNANSETLWRAAVLNKAMRSVAIFFAFALLLAIIFRKNI